MIIDAHQHVFWHGRDDAGLVADMDEQGIDVAWLLAWEVPPEEDDKTYHPVLNPAHFRADGTHKGVPLADVLLARDRYPDRFVPGYCPNPRLPTAPQVFEAAYRIQGVRVCGECKFRMLYDDPQCLQLFRKVGELKCPVVVHLDIPYRFDGKGGQSYDPLWFGGTVQNLERALQACPQTNFLGHAPGFWREISGDADTDSAQYPSSPVTPGGRLYDLLDRYPNLYLDLSAGSGLGALKRDPEHTKRFLTRYSDRALFARDYYGHDLNDFLQSLKLPADVTARIYHENAERLVPLGKG